MRTWLTHLIERFLDWLWLWISEEKPKEPNEGFTADDPIIRR